MLFISLMLYISYLHKLHKVSQYYLKGTVMNKVKRNAIYCEFYRLWNCFLLLGETGENRIGLLC